MMDAPAPSIVTSAVVLSSTPVRVIVCGPGPGMANVILLRSGLKFAAWTASRSEQSVGEQNPSFVSAVLVTTRFCGGVWSSTIVPGAVLGPRGAFFRFLYVTG